VAPAATPYVAVEPRFDPTPYDTTDQGNLIVPDYTHLVFDATQDWYAAPPDSDSRIIVQLFGTRIDVLGESAALVVRGESIDRPVVFTSTGDTELFGDGTSTARPGDWQGIVFRDGSDDWASVIENAAIHYAGGTGIIVPPSDPNSFDPIRRFGISQAFSPITLYDARPSVINTEISNNARAAIAATPNSFERLLGRSGPELFWDVEQGVPIPGDWDPTKQGTEFGVYQAGTGRVYVDLDANFVLDRGTDGPFDLGVKHGVAVVGNFGPAAGDELAIFDRRTGLWTVDLDRSFSVSAGDQTPDGFSTVAFTFGQYGDQPLVGDWDGDGLDEIGVFRPKPWITDLEPVSQQAARDGATVFILDLDGDFQVDADEVFAFGQRDDVPVVGDWNGDGRDEIGVYRPLTGEFLLDRNGDRVFQEREPDLDNDGVPDEEYGTPNGQLDLNDGPFPFGAPGATPVIADWAPSVAGDEIGIFDPQGNWLVDRNGNLEQDITEVGVQFGEPGEVPVPGDWAPDPDPAVVNPQDGDEFGTYQPERGLWFIDRNANQAIEPTEDLDLDGNLDVDEDRNNNGVLDEGEDIDGDGRLDLVNEDQNGNGVLDRNDGGWPYSAALRASIDEFVYDNSINGIWVMPGFQTVSDAHWDDVQLPHVLTGTVEVQALADIGVVPTLQIEPGIVVKMGVANLSVGGFGATLIIDSLTSMSRV